MMYSPEKNVRTTQTNDDSNSRQNPSKTPRLNIFSVWKEYESVAMHFNDLLIRLRTQALGGVAALAALAAVMVRGDLAPALRWSVLACAFLLLMLFWAAVWILDMRYYNRLLHGAVKALLEIEQLSKQDQPVPALALSTRIEETVERGIHLSVEGRATFGGARLPLWLFYGSVGLGLCIGFLVSLVEILNK